MADRMAAEIEIGGPVKRRWVAGLIKAILAESVFVGWGEAIFDATCAEELMDLAQSTSEGGMLVLADQEVAFGYFHRLEAFLVAHRIGFNRHTEAKYEHEGEYVQFRPNMKKPLVQFATQAKTPLVPAHLLQAVRQALDRNQIAQARRQLAKAIGPQVPPLTALRITS